MFISAVTAVSAEALWNTFEKMIFWAKPSNFVKLRRYKIELILFSRTALQKLLSSYYTNLYTASFL